MIKTTIITFAAIATTALGLSLVGVPGVPSLDPVTPTGLNAQIACFNLSIDADGTEISLTTRTELDIDIVFTGDRHIRIGA